MFETNFFGLAAHDTRGAAGHGGRSVMDVSSTSLPSAESSALRAPAIMPPRNLRSKDCRSPSPRRSSRWASASWPSEPGPFRTRLGRTIPETIDQVHQRLRTNGRPRGGGRQRDIAASRPGDPGARRRSRHRGGAVARASLAIWCSAVPVSKTSKPNCIRCSRRSISGRPPVWARTFRRLDGKPATHRRGQERVQPETSSEVR